jgi:hypothetical protein
LPIRSDISATATADVANETGPRGRKRNSLIEGDSVAKVEELNAPAGGREPTLPPLPLIGCKAGNAAFAEA